MLNQQANTQSLKNIQSLKRIVTAGLLSQEDCEVTETTDKVVFSINKDFLKSYFSQTETLADDVPDYLIEKAINAHKEYENTGLHTTQIDMRRWQQQLLRNPTTRVPQCHL